MRTRLSGILVFAMAFMAFGCAAEPTERWAQSAIALELAERSMLTAHEAGQIDDEALVESAPYFEGWHAALNEAYKYLPEGGDIFDAILAGARAWALKTQELTPQEE